MGWFQGKGSAKAPFPGLNEIVSMEWPWGVGELGGALTADRTGGPFVHGSVQVERDVSKPCE